MGVAMQAIIIYDIYGNFEYAIYEIHEYHLIAIYISK